MTITITSPKVLGYRVFFETFNYTRAGYLPERVKTTYDVELWWLGVFHLVITNESKWNIDNNKKKQQGVG